MRILVCGGRNFTNYRLLRKTLNGLFPPSTDDMATWLPPPDTVIIHGAARGADMLADQWAVVNRVQVDRYPADWKTHGGAAGPIRNKRMLVEGKPDLVVAFPGGRGTANCVDQAKSMGIRVIEVQKGESHGRSTQTTRGHRGPRARDVARGWQRRCRRSGHHQATRAGGD